MKHGSQRNNRFIGKRQTGVAIITALLIVTIAATVSITISTQLQLDVRRTGNLVALEQADIYTSLIEKFTQEKLQSPTDFNDLMKILRELGKLEVNYPVENGNVQGGITDLNSCININSLIDPSLPPPSINTLTRDRLTRLFNANAIPNTMVSAIIDWIDADSNTTAPPNGAEDGHYLNLEKPYRTANQPLSSITELRLIQGAESLQATPSIAPYRNILRLAEAFRDDDNNWPSLCVLKNTTATSINVNTASRDVLLALSPTMTTAIVDNIINCRGPSGNEFAAITDFTSCGNVANAIQGNNLNGLDVTSDHFLLKTKVTIGDAKKTTYTIIFRDTTGNTEILSRTQRTL